MDTMNIALPEAMKQFVHEQVRRGGYRSVSEYIRDIIRAAQKETARQALESSIRQHGEKALLTCRCREALGLALKEMGDLAEAERNLRLALEGRRDILGEERSTTLVSMWHLAALLRTKGDLEEAGILAREALEVAEGTLAGLIQEQFGDAKELTLTCAAAPDEEAAALLQSLGSASTCRAASFVCHVNRQSPSTRTPTCPYWRTASST